MIKPIEESAKSQGKPIAIYKGGTVYMAKRFPANVPKRLSGRPGIILRISEKTGAIAVNFGGNDTWFFEKEHLMSQPHHRVRRKSA